MNKLTLSINETVIENAKAYAKANGKSLSRIVEEYLKSLTRPEKLLDNDKSIHELVMELKGSVKLPKNYDEIDFLKK